TRSGAVVSVARLAGLDRTRDAWGQAGVARRSSPSAATPRRRHRPSATAARAARTAARTIPSHHPWPAGLTSTGELREPGPAGPTTDTDTRQGPAAPSMRLAR